MITVAQLLREHVALDVECIDRLYLNGYVPKLQTARGLTAFMKHHLGKPVASPALLCRLTSSFCNAVESFIADNGIPLVRFQRRQRKDDVANAIRAERGIRDGVVFVGVAQEKASAFKGRKVGPYEFEYNRADVFVKHYYFYIDDADFGPAFIKVCTYAPFAVRVCLNGHEWVKRQLARRGVAFEELDNGFLSAGDPDAVQAVCDRLSSFHIEDFFRKWVDRLPFPLADHDRRAGYTHRLSIWQMEFSRTQVFPQPIRGRQFFESVIRENLDLGRPERVKLVFERQVRKNTPGRFSTRVVTNGVHPSIHISYKNTELKQYFKLNRALLCRQKVFCRHVSGSWVLVTGQTGSAASRPLEELSARGNQEPEARNQQRPDCAPRNRSRESSPKCPVRPATSSHTTGIGWHCSLPVCTHESSNPASPASDRNRKWPCHIRCAPL